MANQNDNEVTELVYDDFKIDLPNKTPESWISIQDESFSVNKKEFILAEFRKAYPNIKVKDCEMIYKLASRSENLSEWLSITTASYSEAAQLPYYLEGLVDPSEFKKLSKKVEDVGKQIAASASKRLTEAEKYKKKLHEIDEEERKALQELKGEDKILTILSLTSQKLPLSMQLQIEDYSAVTKENGETVSQRVYAREMLIQYKRALIQLVNDNPDIDLNKIIAGNLVK